MFNLNCNNTISNFLLISRKVCKNIKLSGFALHWLCDTPSPQPKVKVTENGKIVAINIGLTKELVEKFVHNVQHLKLLPCKLAGQTRLIIQTYAFLIWIRKASGKKINLSNFDNREHNSFRNNKYIMANESKTSLKSQEKVLHFTIYLFVSKDK